MSEEGTNNDWFSGAEETLDARAASEAELEAAVSWRPDKDEAIPYEIQGEVFSDIRMVSTKFGAAYILYVKDLSLIPPSADDDEPIIWELFASRSVFKRELQEAAPAVGSLIVVRWEGLKQSSSGGRSYHGYKVMAQTPDAELWAGLVREAYEVEANLKPEIDDTIATEADLERVF